VERNSTGASGGVRINLVCVDCTTGRKKPMKSAPSLNDVNGLLSWRDTPTLIKYIRDTLLAARETKGKELFRCAICLKSEKLEWNVGMQSYFFTISPKVNLSWCCSDACKTAFLLQQESYEGCVTEKE
jgi:hypothetical protein